LATGNPVASFIEHIGTVDIQTTSSAHAMKLKNVTIEPNFETGASGWSSTDFARWLFPSDSSDITVLKTELSTEPIRADSVTFLQTSNDILHLEFTGLRF
jgi:hypothetical protein